jgi:uncharacterized protein with HEPN domain
MRNDPGILRFHGTQIISLRNRLIHGYDAIDYEILWQIMNNDLPWLVFSLERILGIEFEQSGDRD